VLINDRFILAEDAALKEKVSGLRVTYPRNIDVGAWFRWPDKELRDVKRPFIAVELADFTKSERREHQGAPFELGYTPRNAPERVEENSTLIAEEWPTPYDLIYSVTVVSSDPRHDRELKYKLVGDPARLPTRWAYLEIEDGTTRRLDVLGIDSFVQRSSSLTEFYTVFSIRVESELFVSQIHEVRTVFSGANITLTHRELSEQIAATE
jgi:hypothetical protein